MTDPFLIAPPAQISFSGGRTSAYMLHRVLQAHGGTLPAGIEVTFFNTGKEREETLEFVRECEARWGVPVAWLEYDRVQDYVGEWHNTYRVVDFATASRNGEPFAKLIAGRRYLPNVVTRFCTSELKVRIGKKYMLARGHQQWLAAIGIRADEPRRLRNTSDSRERWTRVHPLADAGVVVEDVMEFWRQQRGGMELEAWLAMPKDRRPGWDLGIRQDEGNCDLCFLKGRQKLVTLINERPESAGWWIGQEKQVGERAPNPALGQFNSRRSYTELVERARGGPLFCDVPEQGSDEAVEDCHCTD